MNRGLLEGLSNFTILLTFASCLFGFDATGAPGALKWQKPFSTPIFGAPAMTMNGDLLLGTSDGTLCCIAANGYKKWNFTTPGIVYGTPAVADDGAIYFGSEQLYALNADGTERWKFQLTPYANYIACTEDPALGPDGAVYVARQYAPGGSGRLHAINPDGTRRWITSGGFIGEVIVATDGSLLAATEYSFACVNPDGVIRWTIESHVLGSAAVMTNGTVVIPINGYDYREGAVQAVTPQGSNLWRFAGSAQAVGSPIIGPDGTVYYGFDNGRLVALDSLGGLKWEYKMTGTGDSGRLRATPALGADGTLYFSGERFLHALGSNGALLWRFEGTNTLGSPLLAPDGTLYVADSGGILYAVEGNGGGLAIGQWPMARRDVRHQAKGTELLLAPPTPDGLQASLSNYTDKVVLSWISAPPASHYVISRGTTTNFAEAQVLASNVTGTISFDDRSALAGEKYWYFVQSRNAAGISAPTAAVQGVRRVASLGEAIWAFSSGGTAFTPAIRPDGTLVFGSGDGNLYAVNADGSLKWKYYFGDAVCGTPSIGADGSVYFNAEFSPTSSAFIALDSEGRLRWKFMDSGELTGGAIASDGTVYVASCNHASGDLSFVKAFDQSGSNVWTFKNGKGFTSTPGIGADGTVYAGTREGYMVALGSDGKLLWECSTGDGYLKTPVIDTNGVLFTAGARFYAINTDGHLLWSASTQEGIEAGPSCIDTAGSLVAQGDYACYRFDSDGSNMIKLALSGFDYRTPHSVLSDVQRAVYMSAYSIYGDLVTGVVYGLSAEGAKQWEFRMVGVQFGRASLATNNILYVPGSDGMLYALRTAAGLGNSAWPHPLHDPQHTARAVHTLSVPGAPTNLTATTLTRVTDVRLTWNTSLRAVGYEIYRSDTTNIADAILVGSVIGSRVYDDSSAMPQRSYTYWVKARNASGSSEFSAPASGTRRQAIVGEVLYEWSLYGQIDTSPAIANDGTVYVSVNYPVDGASDAGRKVVAVRPDGSIRWQYLTGQANLSSPSIGSDGTIYVGCRGALNLSPYASPLLALNPDGTVRWQLMADDGIDTTPTIGVDGTIYAGSSLGTLYAVSPEGEVLWTNRLGGGLAAPAIGRDGTFYCIIGANALAAIGPNGRVLWNVSCPFGSGVLSELALASDGAIIASCGYHGLKVFNTDGTLRWQQNQGTPFLTPPVIGIGDAILVGNFAQSGEAAFSCFSPGGTNLWKVTAGGSNARAAAVLADGTVLISSFASKLFAVSSAGSNLWELARGSASSSPPSIAPDGTIYIGGQDGKLRSVFGTSPLASTAWPMFQHDARHTGRDHHAPALPEAATAIRATDGTYNSRIRLTWVTAPGAAYYEVWRGSSSNATDAVCISTNVSAVTFFDDYASLAGTQYLYWIRSVNRAGVSALSGPDSGYRRVAVPGEPMGEGIALETSGTPALGANGDIYVGGGFSHSFYALSRDLSIRWKIALGYPSTPVVGEDGQIYAWSSDGRFYGLDPGGATNWWFAGNYDTTLPAAVAADGALIIADRTQTVSCFDPVAQVLRWQYAARSEITAAPAIALDGAVYVGTRDGQLHVLNNDGTLRWRFRAGGPVYSSPALGSDGTVYFGSDDRGIYAVGRSGRLLWAAQATGAVSASPVIGPDGSVIVGSKDGLLHAFSSEGKRLWQFAGNGAIYDSACVGEDGTVYFVTREGWVHALDRLGRPVWSFNSATNDISGYTLSSPLLLEDHLLVPFSGGLQAFAVSAGPARMNWPQYRHDARHTGRASTWLSVSVPQTPGIVAGESVKLMADLALAGRSIGKIELIHGTNVLAMTNGPGNTLTWAPDTAGEFSLGLRVVDDAGSMHLSAPFKVTIASRPRLAISRAPGSQTCLTFSTVAGRRYQVQRSADLKNWQSAEEFIAVQSTQAWTDSQSPESPVYYRVILMP